MCYFLWPPQSLMTNSVSRCWFLWVYPASGSFSSLGRFLAIISADVFKNSLKNSFSYMTLKLCFSALLPTVVEIGWFFYLELSFVISILPLSTSSEVFLKITIIVFFSSDISFGTSVHCFFTGNFYWNIYLKSVCDCSRELFNKSFFKVYNVSIGHLFPLELLSWFFTCWATWDRISDILSYMMSKQILGRMLIFLLGQKSVWLGSGHEFGGCWL